MPCTSPRKASFRKAITWSLIVAFLTLVVFPFHYHLHHATDAGAHAASGQAHVLDVHVLSDLGAADHHPVDSHAIDPNSPVPLNPGQSPLLFVLLAFAIVLLSVLPRQLGPLRWPPVARQSIPLVAYASPPLRAPPHR